MSIVNTLARACSAAAILTLALAAQAPTAFAQNAGADGQSAGPRSSPRALVQGCGKLSKTEVVVNSKSQNTDSVTFVSVEGSDTFFSVAGQTASCVIVSFSAQAFASGIGAVMLVRALLDGKPSIDGEIQLVAESGLFSDAHAYNFTFPSVSPGDHDFRMEYRSLNNDTVAITDFNMNIRHR
jgi:hypothetical protein